MSIGRRFNAMCSCINVLLSLIIAVMAFAGPPARADTISEIINGKTYICTSQGNSAPTCIQHCTARNSAGTCYQYGNDYCAHGNVSCAAHCTARNSAGTCYQYGGDVCGQEQESCTPNCTARNSAGTCYQYGPDTCG